MQVLRSRLAIALLAGLAVACSGTPAATQGPGNGGPTAGPQATSAGQVTSGPAATQGGGGVKPAGWDQYGKVHIEITGPVQKTGDYGFVPAASVFGGAQGSSLNFNNDDGGQELVSILISPDGSVIVSYAGGEFTAPAAQCTTSNWNIGSTTGSGSFECTAAFVILASGATVSGASLKGSFDAHA